MINEREEFLSYINFPEYSSKSKQDYSYLGRFTLEMFEDLTGFNRVLTILARGYMFDEEGNADIARAERAIRAWCSVPDKKNAKPLEDWQYITDFRALHDEFPELVDKNGKGWLCRHIANIVSYVKKNPDIAQISINFHTPYPGTEHLMLPNEKKVEIIDKVLEYKRKGYPIMNSRSGLKLMKRNTLGEIKLGKECFVTNFIYTDGSRSLCLGYGTEQCRVCGFCMAGEMASVWSFRPDTILAGFKLRM